MPMDEVMGWTRHFARYSGNERLEHLLAQILVLMANYMSRDRKHEIHHFAPWLEGSRARRARIHEAQVQMADMVAEAYMRKKRDSQ